MYIILHDSYDALVLSELLQLFIIDQIHLMIGEYLIEYSLIYVYRTIDIKEGTTINIQISYDFIQSCLNLKDYILTSLIPKYAGLLDWKNDSSQSTSTSVVVQTNQERKKKEVVINVCLQLIHISGFRQDSIR